MTLINLGIIIEALHKVSFHEQLKMRMRNNFVIYFVMYHLNQQNQLCYTNILIFLSDIYATFGESNKSLYT